MAWDMIQNNKVINLVGLETGAKERILSSAPRMDTRLWAIVYSPHLFSGVTKFSIALHQILHM